MSEKAGSFDIPVRVIREVVTGQSAETGRDILSWQTYIPRLWVNRQDSLPSRRQENLVGAGAIPLEQRMTRIRYRYNPAKRLDSKMRIVLGGVTLLIVGGPSEVRSFGTGRVYEVLCEEVT